MAVNPRNAPSSAELSQIRLLPEELLAQSHLFPDGRLDQDLQQIDLRGRNSWRLQMARSEEHTSELQSLMRISYAVFCLKNNTIHNSVLTHHPIYPHILHRHNTNI